MLIHVAMVLVLLQSCNNSAKNKTPDPVKHVPLENQVAEKQRFFPVTTYIKGQLFEITQKGITPLKYSTINGHTDSVWLKTENFTQAFSEFLHPEIDSANLISLFTEKKFMDQTIDAFTFTYDPAGVLPDSMTLNHWDVYIDPASGKVRRIYMVKNIGENKTIQLTWQGDKWCKTIYIITNPDGTSTVEKEEKITWSFDIQ